MSFSKLSQRSNQHYTGAQEEKLQNVKIIVNSLRYELKAVQKLLDTTTKSLQRYQADNDSLKKLNRTLITTVQEQNEILKVNGLDVVTVATELARPVVDPLATMDTIKRLRERLADTLDALENEKLDKFSARKDVLQLEVYQFELDQLGEEAEHLRDELFTYKGSSTDHRRIQGLREALKIQKSLNSKLVSELKASRSSRSDPPGRSGKLQQLAEDCRKDSSDTGALEQELTELKRRNASLSSLIDKLCITMAVKHQESGTIMPVTKPPSLEDSNDSKEDDLIFQARMGEMDRRVECNKLRRRLADQQAEITSLKSREEDLIAEKLELQRRLIAAEKKKATMSSYVESHAPDARNYPMGLGSLHSRSSSYAGAEEYSSISFREIQPQSAAAASLSMIARSTPGIMSVRSSDPVAVVARGGQAATVPDTGMASRSRGPGARTSGPEVLTSVNPHKQNFSSLPSTLECPRCGRRFPATHRDELLRHLDTCY